MFGLSFFPVKTESLLRKSFVSGLLSTPILALSSFFAPEALAIDIPLDGTGGIISGTDCSTATYRFGSTAVFGGQNLDLLVEVLDEDTETLTVANCVQVTNGRLELSLRDRKIDGNNSAFMNIRVTVVQEGTSTPVAVDRLTMTALDLDINPTGGSSTDDVYVQLPDSTYISTTSLVGYQEGTFFSDFDIDLEGTSSGNCVDTIATPDPACRASTVHINGPGGVNSVSSIVFRVQNDNAFGTRPFSNTTSRRRFDISFLINDFEETVSDSEDYGDAPDTYGVNTGHTVSGLLSLGNGLVPDLETAVQTSANANGDDDDDGGASDPDFDDEDGVQLGGQALDGQSLNAGETTNLDVTTFGAGFLSVWVDLDGDGNFTDTGEQVVDDLSISSGTVNTTSVPITIPSSATAGDTYMRFRYSAAQGVDATSFSSANGEVEDYEVEIAAPSFPDPPVIGPGDGDTCLLTHHSNSGVVAVSESFYGIDDHTDPNTLNLISPWNVSDGTVEALTTDPGTGTFYALNGDRGGALFLGTVNSTTGEFDDITTTGITTLSHSTFGTLDVSDSRGMAFQPGTNTIWAAAYDVVPSSNPGNNFFYLFQIDATTGTAIPNAFGPGDDYLAIDLAPYIRTNPQRASVEALAFFPGSPNLLYGVVSTLSGGASTDIGHLFAIDVSAASPTAILAPQNLQGTDFDASTVITSNIYDIEGMSFDDNGDLIIVSSNVGGANSSSLFFVDLATGAASGKRTLISGDWEGIACNAPLPSLTSDFGDAPISYDDTDGSGSIDGSDTPAEHAIANTLNLGSVAPDSEITPQNSVTADGDDDATSPAIDDEDGISVFPSLSTNATSYSLDLTVNNDSGSAANVYAWIDFDGDGEFDEDERATVSDGTITLAGGQVPTGSNGTVTLNWSNIGTNNDIVDGDSFSRVRVTTDDLDSTTETTERDDASSGTASDGEVEDYSLEIAALPELLLVKRITAINGTDLTGFESDDGRTEDDNPNWPTPLSTYLRGAVSSGVIAPGDEVEFTIYFLSSGDSELTNLSICDLVPDNMTFVADAFQGLLPLDTSSLAGTDVGIALASDDTTLPTAPTAYLTNVGEGDRGEFFLPNTGAPSTCNLADTSVPLPASSNLRGAVVVQVVDSATTLPNAIGPGTPPDSYGFIRFRATVD
ncbi:MAG: GEVED domain-containing protein [Cyanobacteria bacterium J06642_2]